MGNNGFCGAINLPPTNLPSTGPADGYGLKEQGKQLKMLSRKRKEGLYSQDHLIGTPS